MYLPERALEVGAGLVLERAGLLGKPPPKDPEHPQAARRIVSRATGKAVSRRLPSHDVFIVAFPFS
jgi:hypothetical protein